MANSTTDKPHCGETCPVLDFMTHVCNDRMTVEERMEAAIKACTDPRDGHERMSQMAAAKKFNVARRTLGDHIARLGQGGGSATPTQSPAPQGKPVISPDSVDHDSPFEERIAAAVAANLSGAMTQREAARVYRVGQSGISKRVKAVKDREAKSDLPPPPQETLDDVHDPIPAPDHQPPILPAPTHDQPDDRAEEDRGSSFDAADHPAFADDGQFDINAVAERVNRDIQRSDRPADFKRAIELLTELGRICQYAWEGSHPEPWGHDDWAHVASEIDAIQSLVSQRATEAATDLLRRCAAIEVKSTTID